MGFLFFDFWLWDGFQLFSPFGFLILVTFSSLLRLWGHANLMLFFFLLFSRFVKSSIIYLVYFEWLEIEGLKILVNIYHHSLGQTCLRHVCLDHATVVVIM